MYIYIYMCVCVCVCVCLFVRLFWSVKDRVICIIEEILTSVIVVFPKIHFCLNMSSIRVYICINVHNTTHRVLKSHKRQDGRNICNHENNVPSRLSITTMALWQLMHLGNCHRPIMVIIGRAHCFHNCIYILHNNCIYIVVDHLWPLILHSLLSFLSTLWFIGASNV